MFDDISTKLRRQAEETTMFCRRCFVDISTHFRLGALENLVRSNVVHIRRDYGRFVGRACSWRLSISSSSFVYVIPKDFRPFTFFIRDSQGCSPIYIFYTRFPRTFAHSHFLYEIPKDFRPFLFFIRDS